MRYNEKHGTGGSVLLLCADTAALNYASLGEPTGHADAQAPQSMHVSALIV